MTLQDERPHFAYGSAPLAYAPRVRLTPEDQRIGDVGGAWWPRSHDLLAELPGLLVVLAGEVGTVERVVYDPAGWDGTPGQLVTGGATVTLDAYRYESFNMLYAYGVDGASIVLRVIPAGTADAAAKSALLSI
jgi:hypothetical protein